MGKGKKKKWSRKCCLSWRGGLVGKVGGEGVGGLLVGLGSWNTIPSVHGGFLWRERNACCFDRQDLSVAKLKYLLLKSFNEWKSSPMSSLTGLLKYLDFLGLHLSFVVVFISYFYKGHLYLEWV